ncbi:MAG: ABC transporter permease, partial [bacterium]|nr:ABC transporter permease [bacterium]
MFKNYLKTAFRNLYKYKGYTLINVAGLSIGMICCILIFLFIQDELSYDRFHENSDRIFRVLEFVKDGDVGEESASQPVPAGPKLIEDYPHLIKAQTRFFNMQSPSLTVRY